MATLALLSLLPTITIAAVCKPSVPSGFTNLVSFDDNYTDEGHRAYYLANNDTWPPAGPFSPKPKPRPLEAMCGHASLYKRPASNRSTTQSLDQPARRISSSATRRLSLPSFLADLEFEDALYVGGRTPENTVYSL
ncbi:hypothetical protein BJY00DRAFT_314603 [Aspergillus carlsbadensis]|nr:hypothetical protein BJY00DRAFT_314603 [Aspergillus carlsbadensis]